MFNVLNHLTVTPAVLVTQKRINYYVRYRMYTYLLKNNGLFVYVFVTQLGKITINFGNYQNIAFHSKSLDMSRPCILYINIC